MPCPITLTSLNYCLNRGPNLVALIPYDLKKKNLVYLSDIEKASLQVSVKSFFFLMIFVMDKRRKLKDISSCSSYLSCDQ